VGHPRAFRLLALGRDIREGPSPTGPRSPRRNGEPVPASTSTCISSEKVSSRFYCFLLFSLLFPRMPFLSLLTYFFPLPPASLFRPSSFLSRLFFPCFFRLVLFFFSPPLHLNPLLSQSSIIPPPPSIPPFYFYFLSTPTTPSPSSSQTLPLFVFLFASFFPWPVFLWGRMWPAIGFTAQARWPWRLGGCIHGNDLSLSGKNERPRSIWNQGGRPCSEYGAVVHRRPDNEKHVMPGHERNSPDGPARQGGGPVPHRGATITGVKAAPGTFATCNPDGAITTVARGLRRPTSAVRRRAARGLRVGQRIITAPRRRENAGEGGVHVQRQRLRS